MLAFAQQVYPRDDAFLLSRSYYLDQTNALTINEVMHKTFTPYREILTGGYQSGTYWIKLKARASQQDLVLKIRPTYTDEIELFDPASQSREQKSPVGANYPWGATDIEALSHNFVLAPSPADREIYLRVKSKQSYLVYAELMPMTEYVRGDRVEQLLYMGYAAFTLILATWLLITWLMSRELVLGVFTLQQFMAFLHTFTKVGLAKFLADGLLEASTINQLANLVVVIYPFIGFLSNKLLLQEYGLKRTFKWVFDALLGLSVLIIVLYLSGYSSILKFNALLVLGGMSIFWISAMFGVDRQQATLKASALPIAMLRVFYSVNMLIWVVAVLPLLGMVTASPVITLNSILVYNMLSGLMFFFLLQYRSKALLKLETERASSLKVEAEQERKQREEQSMLMAMLSHEIKTPLSVLKLVVDEKVAGSDLEGHANRAVNNIDFIVERCLQLGKLDAEAIQLHQRSIHLLGFLSGIVEAQKAENRVHLTCLSNIHVKTDHDLLRVLISNLLENALKYSPAASTIDLDARYKQEGGVEGVMIEIANEVSSLGAPDSAQVFKKFYRNPSATKISGSGLGLFLVRQLIRVLGGDISYQSDAQRVRFTLWMPT